MKHVALCRLAEEVHEQQHGASGHDGAHDDLISLPASPDLRDERVERWDLCSAGLQARRCARQDAALLR